MTKSIHKYTYTAAGSQKFEHMKLILLNPWSYWLICFYFIFPFRLGDCFTRPYHFTLRNLRRKNCSSSCCNGCQVNVMLLIHQQETWFSKTRTSLGGNLLLTYCPSSIWCQNHWDLLKHERFLIEGVLGKEINMAYTFMA